MVVPVLCLVCFFFLCWILILKSELAQMRKELERAKVTLREKLGHIEKTVVVEQGRPLRGREAEGSLLRFP
jgi:hypothetical protein